MPPLARVVILVGFALVAIGLVLWLVPGVSWLGRLPGDVRIERGGWRIFVPITTSIVLSIVLSLVLWLLSRVR